MDLLGTVPARYGKISSLADHNPEFVVGLRGLKSRIWFVNSANTNSSRDGRSWDGAVTSIATLLSQSQPPQTDDVVCVAPGHTETVSAAGTVDINTAGLTFLGFGRGRRRPKIEFTTAVGADMNIDGANITFNNFYFDATAFDNVTAALDVNAADFHLLNCEVELADASGQVAIFMLTDDNCDRFVVEGCYFHGGGDTTAVVPISTVGGDDWIVRDNIFIGYFGTTGAIQNATTATVNYTIVGNVIINRTADGDNKTVVMHSSSVGMIANNRFGIIDSISPAPITAAAGWVGGNYSASAVGVTAGTLI